MKNIYMIIPAFLFLCSCEETDFMPARSKSALVYMVADNDLDYYAIWNIKRMEQGLPENTQGSIYVFVDRNIGGNPSHPYLLKITRDTLKNEVTSTILQTYPEQNTCDPNSLNLLIKDVQQICAAQNSQLSRLVLWSHGTGWLPEGSGFSTAGQNAALRSFGLDNVIGNSSGQKEMDIKDLAVALKDFHFDLLIMDACFMGTIEVAYELKNSFDYMLLSPSEILSNGFPYTDITADLVSDNLNTELLAEKFFTYYNNGQNTYQSATISIINTRHLNDLAIAMQDIYQKYKICAIDNVNTIPQYDRTLSNYFFDMKHLVSCVSNQTGSDFSYIMNLYDKAVCYYRHTEKMFSTLDLSETNGLSIYIPSNNENRTALHSYYKQLEWAKQSNANILFD
jgi:hypothetical protein